MLCRLVEGDAEARAAVVHQQRQPTVLWDKRQGSAQRRAGIPGGRKAGAGTGDWRGALQRVPGSDPSVGRRSVAVVGRSLQLLNMSHVSPRIVICLSVCLWLFVCMLACMCVSVSPCSCLCYRSFDVWLQVMAAQTGITVDKWRSAASV